MKDNKNYYLLKTIIIFVCYMFYSVIFNKIFSLFGLNNTIISMIIADIIFFIGIIYVYKDRLKNEFNYFRSKYSFKDKIWTIIKWVLIILSINILMGILTELFYSNIAAGVDENAMAVTQLFDASFMYSLFKTLIFAPIAEELLFKEAIRDVVKNNIAFILISSSIYTAMNFMYASTDILLLDLIKYFMFSVILSLAYIKNNDNIVVVIFIKLFYNLLPTLLLIITMIVGVSA